MSFHSAAKDSRYLAAAPAVVAVMCCLVVAHAQEVATPPPDETQPLGAAAQLVVPPIEKPETSATAPDDGADDGAIELGEMQVQGTAVKNSVATERRNALVTVDLMTNQDMNKFIATDVSDAIVRMPGLSSTSRGSFAVVRGLAERYNPILLDGIVLPSSDPEKQTPELDIFPTRLVDAIVVNKVFSPHLPATSTGGAVDLRTKPLPEGRFAQVQFGLRADDGFLGGDRFRSSDTPGHWDLLAFGTKDRPSAPADGAAARAMAGDPATNWISEGSDYPIGTRFAVAFEDRIDLGGSGKAMGYAFSLGYDSFGTTEDGRVIRPGPVPFGSTALADQYGNLPSEFSGEDYSIYEQEVRLGGLFSLGFAFSSEHTLSLSAFVSQIGKENVTQIYNSFPALGTPTVDQLNLLYQAFDTGVVDPEFAGVGGPANALTQSESIYYRQRNLTDIKLSGEHKWDGVLNAKLGWAVARIIADQDEPDFSYLPYFENFPPVEGRAPLSILYGQPVRQPTRFWRNVGEETWAGKVDLEFQFRLGWMNAVTAGAGVYREATERSYEQDAFFLTAGPQSRGATLPDLVKDLQTALDTRSLVPTPAAADAERDLTAAYLSASLPLIEGRSWVHKLSLYLGARLESYEFLASGRGTLGNQSSADYYLTTSVNQKLPPGSLPSVNVPDTVYSRELDEDTVHPTIALNWSPRNRMNVRLAYSETVARPSFREMGPYFTNDDVTNEAQHGNVYLNTSDVANLDFRFEFFVPNSRDLVALSFFKKTIENPIEKQADVITGGGFTALGWFNNPNTAHLKGVEIEAARNLGFLGEAGSWFTVGGNATFIDAESTVAASEFAVLGTKRNLYDQPDWIANAYLTFDQPRLGFSSTVSWFAISDVLRNTSTDSWATYVESYDRLDLTVNQRIGKDWVVRFSVKNLTDPERRFVADPAATTERITYRSFKDGRTFSLSLTWDL